jgi:ornithine carbamoyltransferase
VSPNLHHRSLLDLQDLSPAEIRYLIDLAVELKAAKAQGTERKQLQGRNIALIFEKASTRTRCAFEVAVHDQGGHVTYIDPVSSQMGHKESLKDTARVLGRMFDGIEYRGFHQSVVQELAAHAKVPVWNGLTDEAHPTQVLADLMTMEEFADRPLHALSFCYLGDARFNMGCSLLVGGVQMGMDVRIACPPNLQPPASLVADMVVLARSTGAQVRFFTDPVAAVQGADFVYTDVWVSMGEPSGVWAERIAALSPYAVTEALMRATGRRSFFMHCLPAFHTADTEVGKDILARFGLDHMEVSDAVFESQDSIVFTQAENRLHTIKALLVATLG